MYHQFQLFHRIAPFPPLNSFRHKFKSFNSFA